MKHARKHIALFILMLFSCYYSGISMFSHVHIVNGASIVHSHLGGGSEHNHSEGQYVVIDLLSNFQSEAAVDCILIEAPYFLLTDISTDYISPSYFSENQYVHLLRGPPQA